MTSSLVGSEMCIRDRMKRQHHANSFMDEHAAAVVSSSVLRAEVRWEGGCLLYTSDAADDM
eukprot:1579885-Prorocentrum_lima.AAC.1